MLTEFERYKEASYENISELQKKLKNLEKTIVSKDKEISRMKSETENSDTEYPTELQSEFIDTQSRSMVDDLRGELRNKNPAEYRVLKMDSNWDSIDPTVVVYRRASHNSSVIEEGSQSFIGTRASGIRCAGVGSRSGLDHICGEGHSNCTVTRSPLSSRPKYSSCIKPCYPELANVLSQGLSKTEKKFARGTDSKTIQESNSKKFLETRVGPLDLTFNGFKIGDREKSHLKIETEKNSKTPVGDITRNFISLYSNRPPTSAEKILAPTTWATGKTGDSIPQGTYYWFF